tara:strand:+ start:2209 stop:3138 length:930 start_codon:yes stop_codon:yes gene_type:complete
MKNFCTVADDNFTEKVLALNSSLARYQSDYILHLLCVDDEVYNKCNEPNIKKYRLADLLESDPVLKKAQFNPASREALINTANNIEQATRLQFIWALASYFTWWCTENLELEDILYIDSDIYFFRDLSGLRESIKDCSVGIIEHRCPYSPVNGKYNVGIVYFKNNFQGYKVLTWWKNCLLKHDNEYSITHGTCGDQKYLEVFEELTDEVKVLDPDIGHLAPWNFLSHDYSSGKITWNSYTQDLLYCHFSNFKPDYENNSYQLAPRHGFISAPATNESQRHFIKHIADQYYNDLKEAHEKTKNSLRDDCI